MKARYNFTIDENVLKYLKLLAKRDNRPVSNYLEHLITTEYHKYYMSIPIDSKAKA